MEPDKAGKEQRALKQKVETLERENMLLKKSLFELSSRYNSIAHKLQPFNPGELLYSAHDAGINSLLENTEQEATVDRFAANRDKSTIKDNKPFYLKHELKGHTGAVYAVQYSPCGRFVSSGSFDKTVRIWDQKEVHTLRGHTLNVSDLSWSSDSTELLSGAYDQTCKTWDVESGKLIESFDSEGFVQCVMFSSKDKNIYFSGTSRNILCMTDRRDPNAAISIRNDSMVNSLYVSNCGQYVVSGDAAGCIRTWDIRTGKSVLNESTKKPISHIACYPSPFDKDEDFKYMAVNSYDNVIRVYDRGFAPAFSPYRLVHMLKGYKNKNWPIKSAFFSGRDVNATLRGPSSDDIFGKGDVPGNGMEASTFEKSNGIDMLLATGSADPFVYVYSFGSAEGSAELVQRLEGHTDRVYAVSFHPTEPILCSCSADFTLKLWYSSKGKRK
ncbi:hypothetical protein BASA50_002724 [Batrachochytrium salamandrivorans]|uniref:WD40 repeat-like protein n=1 Tax=Batrachochytrium salamandrivorans TaxID=1357716 RepID=A0ABQ8FLR8_9FUNG|nr:hypothetical protein BASA62_004706 [Batrachochytrium salamandrivorans]KAH6577673.1 hypothetical protein BASA60_003935 [Batrachochytrium salamandrivorans]KAH6583886.1 hypothetical protein BASA61_007795 [Batrachochytrium salamandrivorans]KAH6599853.1 hypothetical protein BASA50_002724 [Batrachochytrium salamandrivorans]KAH9248908.1 hypothetical protein BASA81_013420 [Batrachochytrium salamandrivorans]